MILSELIPKVQEQLIDDGTRFTATTCTAAIRAALKTLNQKSPLLKSVEITAVADTLIYNLTSSDSGAKGILSVYKKNNYQRDTILVIDKFWEGANLKFRLRSSFNNPINVYYYNYHTIADLDGATVSTLDPEAEQVIVDGACYYALTYISSATVETNNLMPYVSRNYRQIAETFYFAFTLGLSALATRPQEAHGEPPTSAWNDKWHGWDA